MSKYNDKAVALKYRKNRDKAPVIVASGSGSIARKIVEIADKKNIPVYVDTATATVLSQLQVGASIPVELYNVVANIYACIINMANNLKNKRTINTDNNSNFNHENPTDTENKQPEEGGNAV